MWPSCGATPSMACGKKITRGHKKKLSRAERKEFRSLLWEFRRDPKDLTEEDRQKLEKLFTQIPKMRTLYQLRVRFKQLFDAPLTPKQAGEALTELLLDAMDAFPELESFTCTFERW